MSETKTKAETKGTIVTDAEDKAVAGIRKLLAPLTPAARERVWRYMGERLAEERDQAESAKEAS